MTEHLRRIQESAKGPKFCLFPVPSVISDCVMSALVMRVLLALYDELESNVPLLFLEKDNVELVLILLSILHCPIKLYESDNLFFF